MNTTFAKQIGCRSATLWVALLLCLGGPACFRAPDMAKIPCVAPSNCPSGYYCAKNQEANQGICAPGSALGDGSSADLSLSTGDDGSLGRDTNDAKTTDGTVGGAGGAGGQGGSTADAPLGGFGGSVTSDGSSGAGGTSTTDVPLAGASGTGGGEGVGGAGGEGGAGTKQDAPTGAGGTTTLSTTGAKCTDDTECALGFCVDGVCCDSRCGGQCQACAETSSVGTCTTVQSGVPRGTRTSCAGTDKCKGQCDGSSATACKMPGNTTVCQSESCTGSGQHTPESVCDGTGVCPTHTASLCSTGACATDNSGRCLGSCTPSSCPTDQYCAATGSCTPKKGNGTGNTCTTGAECSSNHCASVDGVCCDSDCTGQCQTCNNSTGACTRVASGQPAGNRAACAGANDATCGGRCNNTSDNCYFPAAGTQCAAETCANPTMHQFAGTCPGSGNSCSFPNPSTEPCPYGCSNRTCASGHMISFDKNDSGATGSMARQPVASGASVSLTANAFMKACSNFAGWATSANGAVAYTDGTNYTMTASSDVVLYAKWTPAVTTGTIAVNAAKICPWGSATFTVSGFSGTGLVYYWSLNGTQRTTTYVPTVTLNNLTVQDAGNWTCTVANSSNCSSSTSNSAQLSFYAPTATVSPSSYTWDGSSSRAYFSATAQGSYGYTYNWVFQMAGDSTVHNCSESNGKYFSNVDQQTLTVVLPSPAGSSQFWCQVTDACGSSVDSDKLSYSN
jgi:hypothetical protein